MARPLPEIVRAPWPLAAGEPSAAVPAATAEAIDRAAAILIGGGLVAMPTETVYGLAANALDEEAVAGIFRAKGRPATNPLIVHVADAGMARRLSASWPTAAEAVATHLWPGPVTVVVPRSSGIPDLVTAGGDTVAIRCPAHPLARRLIEVTGVPLAAPSANRSEAVSPTTAHHVLESLGNRIDLILDGGPCAKGIESTVVDCTVSPPRILRPGPLSREVLEQAIGERVVWPEQSEPTEATARSPGQRARHYAPRTPLSMADDAVASVAELLAEGRRVGWLTTLGDDPAVRSLAASHDLVVVPMPADPEGYAALLYATLRALDQRQLDRIVVETPPEGDAWRAVGDRLTRAATA